MTQEQVTHNLCDKAVSALKSEGHDACTMKHPYNSNFDDTIPSTWGVWIKVWSHDLQDSREFRVHDEEVIWWANYHDEI